MLVLKELAKMEPLVLITEDQITNVFALQDILAKIATKMKTIVEEMPAHLVPNV
jgi:hypothetical protein